MEYTRLGTSPGRAVGGGVGGLLIAAWAIGGRAGADGRQSVDAAVPTGDVAVVRLGSRSGNHASARSVSRTTIT